MENIKNNPSPKQSGKSDKSFDVKTLAGVGLLTAIVVVLHLVSMGLKIGTFNITLTLVPIVVGAALYGWKYGAWLGFVFGMAVLLTGASEPFFSINPLYTIIIVLLKGAIAGLCAALIFHFLEKKNQTLAVIAAAVTAPVVNTGVFLLGCRLFFYDVIKEFDGAEKYDNTFVFMLVGLVGINFFIELGINIVLNPVIVRIINIGKKKLKSNG